MRFKVTMERNERRQHEFVVEAEKARDLEGLGEQLAADYDYHDAEVTDVEYQLFDWCEIDENGDEKEELDKFTLLLDYSYPDGNNETYCEHVDGIDAQDALQRFFADPLHGETRRKYARLLAVLLGHHANVMDPALRGE